MVPPGSTPLLYSCDRSEGGVPERVCVRRRPLLANSPLANDDPRKQPPHLIRLGREHTQVLQLIELGPALDQSSSRFHSSEGICREQRFRSRFRHIHGGRAKSRAHPLSSRERTADHVDGVIVE